MVCSLAMREGKQRRSPQPGNMPSVSGDLSLVRRNGESSKQMTMQKMAGWLGSGLHTAFFASMDTCACIRLDTLEEPVLRARSMEHLSLQLSQRNHRLRQECSAFPPHRHCLNLPSTHTRRLHHSSNRHRPRVFSHVGSAAVHPGNRLSPISEAYP
ncbi:hypothetical protein KP509_15G032600 [Ceratopteris richardii]|uniref:Uncharacterized protein n=1 Tax=Ceratopteris richardii TaxID=49495 RepID=A0A8T2T383_CERRI|nr:hypothetical protein KP509_15G032600 [Ceratopteris richardii]